jgi:hypothetical protein
VIIEASVTFSTDPFRYQTAPWATQDEPVLRTSSRGCSTWEAHHAPLQASYARNQPSSAGVTYGGTSPHAAQSMYLLSVPWNGSHKVARRMARALAERSPWTWPSASLVLGAAGGAIWENTYASVAGLLAGGVLAAVAIAASSGNSGLRDEPADAAAQAASRSSEAAARRPPPRQ